MTFATRLKALDLRQTELAQILGVPAQTVNRWAKGHRSPGAVVDAYLRLLEMRPELIPLVKLHAPRRKQ